MSYQNTQRINSPASVKMLPLGRDTKTQCIGLITIFLVICLHWSGLLIRSAFFTWLWLFCETNHGCIIPLYSAYTDCNQSAYRGFEEIDTSRGL